jgi:hypothetical protein
MAIAQDAEKQRQKNIGEIIQNGKWNRSDATGIENFVGPPVPMPYKKDPFDLVVPGYARIRKGLFELQYGSPALGLYQLSVGAAEIISVFPILGPGSLPIIVGARLIAGIANLAEGYAGNVINGPNVGDTLQMVGGGISIVAAIAGIAAASAWSRPPGWRLPRNGTWSGTPGNSDFIPNNPAELGLAEGARIPFRDGYPDFSAWSWSNLEVPGLNGYYDNDLPLIYKEVARVKGLPNPTAAQNWLAEQGLTPHHAGGNSVQILPRRLHEGVRHMGGAWELRNQY